MDSFIHWFAQDGALLLSLAGGFSFATCLLVNSHTILIDFVCMSRRHLATGVPFLRLIHIYLVLVLLYYTHTARVACSQ